MSSIDLTLFNEFSSDAKAWVFILTRPLEADEGAQFTSKLDAFLENWAAHKQPLPGQSQLIDSQILLVVAEPFASGCSIDSLFREVEQIATSVNVQLSPVGTVVVREEGAKPRVVSRTNLREEFSRGEVRSDSPVLNSTVVSWTEVRDSLFLPLEKSPFARLVG